jgi:NADPH2:quinone reductase
MTSLPQTMTAIGFDAPGGPEVLKPQSRPVPKPGTGEVLVAVTAAGINRPDVLQRLGGYNPPPGASDIPGLEFAGTVVALGEGVRRYRLGDLVCGLVAGGGYAQYAIVHESNALPVPSGLSLIEAAAIPETYFTVWTNVFQRGALKAGESFMVQLAKAFGATVLATAGSEEKCAACRELGADHAINYREQDFVTSAKEATGRRGVDLILDMVGGDYINRNYEAAADSGRIVQIAFLNGPKAEANFSRLMLKRLTHTGSTLRPRTIAEKAAIAAELEDKVWPLLAAGRCKPVIHRTFPLAQAAEGQRLMESNAHIGKIVLTV